jgi:DNA polymerase-3 subunit delta
VRPAPVYAVRGDDPELVSQTARALVEELVRSEDPPTTAEERFGEDLDVASLVNACSTPPFFGGRRVVVVRDAGALRQDQAEAIAEYLSAPLASTSLVLVAGGGQLPRRLLGAVSRAGEVVEAGGGRDKARWVAERVGSGAVRLDRGAQRRILAHLGEDLGRVQGLLEVLAAAYGEGATLGEEDLEPFLGDPGSAPPWELTDAVDRGDPAAALAALRRMTVAGQRHPLVVMGVLHRHYGSMLRLDGSDAGSAERAAELLGARSAFRAKKALSAAKRLGPEGIGRAILLLARADLDLRGESGWPADVVLEVLVARLSRLGARSRRPSGRGEGRA